MLRRKLPELLLEAAMIFFAVMLALGARGVGSLFRSLSAVERWVRRVTAVVLLTWKVISA